MKKLTAVFYPSKEEKEKFLGNATITIADAIRLYGISVFRGANEGEIRLSFPNVTMTNDKGEPVRDDEGNIQHYSYIIPKNAEVYASMCAVVGKAMESEKHFGFLPGDYFPRLEVTGKAVQEPFADARFSVEVEGVCTLTGISTNVVTYGEEGNEKSFVAVNKPIISTYKNAKDETQYRPAFEGRINVWKDKEGVEHKRDYGQFFNGLVLAERKKILELENNLDNKIQKAEGSKAPAEPAKDAPAKEAERG